MGPFAGQNGSTGPGVRAPCWLLPAKNLRRREICKHGKPPMRPRESPSLFASFGARRRRKHACFPLSPSRARRNRANGKRETRACGERRREAGMKRGAEPSKKSKSAKYFFPKNTGAMRRFFLFRLPKIEELRCKIMPSRRAVSAHRVAHRVLRANCENLFGALCETEKFFSNFSKYCEEKSVDVVKITTWRDKNDPLAFRSLSSPLRITSPDSVA